MAHLPVEPRIAKMIIYGAIFRRVVICTGKVPEWFGFVYTFVLDAPLAETLCWERAQSFKRNSKKVTESVNNSLQFIERVSGSTCAAEVSLVLVDVTL